MKDAQRWQNRVELSLDNRQIFLLFFASAVVVSLVFALGVVVGKRLDKQPARTAATTDPLAVLDQMGQDNGEDTLTFHDALSNDKTKTASTPARPDAGPAPAVQPTGSKAEPKPTPTRALAEKSAPPAPAVAKSSDQSGKKETGKPKKVAASDDDGTYTLQLSSFQEKREAELFMQKLRGAGMQPYMTPTTIPGRGVWFRVRLGHFKTWEEALSAKQGFEKTQKIIAYVSKM
jgi:DedD protein